MEQIAIFHLHELRAGCRTFTPIELRAVLCMHPALDNERQCLPADPPPSEPLLDSPGFREFPAFSV